ncbi:MAG TPA: cation-transporting P-type ATPase [Ilumatobacter sp.]|nr:cation-transporting P-type ATPase [Ilumatobacter sp.]
MNAEPKTVTEHSSARAAAMAATAVESLPAAAVYGATASSLSGLTSDEAARRLESAGRNVLREIGRPSLRSRLIGHFTHLMALLLWAGAVVALLAGLPELSVAIVLVNVINGVFSFFQEYKAEQAIDALRKLLPVEARVLRDGVEARVDATELVPGDVLLLDEGDRISADARVVEHSELRVDQSSLTGETMPVRKAADPVASLAANRAETANLVFAGTSVSSGRGKAVVIRTGMETEFGRIATLTQELHAAPSPLQAELATLTKVISAVAVGVGVLVGSVTLGLGLMDGPAGLVFGLGMIVAFVPEGLLPTVTLSLAMGTQRMAGRNALVKRLSAVETLGCTSVICSDKTGTLTQNEMTTREVACGAAMYELDGMGYEPIGAVRRVDTPEPDDGSALRAVLVAAGLACNARLAEQDGRWTVLGDPTEAAVVVACRKAGIDLAREAAKLPRVLELPFDSYRKRMSTLHRADDGHVLFVKGAPRELVDLCTEIEVDGGIVELDETHRERMSATNDAMSRRGLRVLAVASRAVGPMPTELDAASLEQRLTLLGLVAMMDPPRPEVEAAVRTCERAGIRTIMITGDYGLTAESIARRVGMVRGDRLRIVNGVELDALDDATLAEILDDEVLFARASPEHKLRVVTALQQRGHIVAVTGDGVNDAPALKRADIGVAMGRSGTDVAREAADMILLDDNFASIVNAVEEGRAVFANIRRFTSYIFTSNTPEAIPFMLFAFSGGRIPLALGVMAILAIDLGTDLVPALALGAEPPEPGTMDRPPRRRGDHIVDRALLFRAYVWLGLVQGLAVMAVFFLHYWDNGYAGQWLDLPDEGVLAREAVAIALAAVVFTQIGNLFAQRTERSSIIGHGWFTNRLIWIGIASELVVVALIVYVPFLQSVIGTAALPAKSWLWVLALTPLLLLTDELRKVLTRRGHSKLEVST